MTAASKSHGSQAVREPWMWKPFVNCKGLGQWRVVPNAFRGGSLAKEKVPGSAVSIPVALRP